MWYLTKNGDEFRELSFDEYKKSQPKADPERFKKVIKYLKNEDTVRLFSPNWDI